MYGSDYARAMAGALRFLIFMACLGIIGVMAAIVTAVYWLISLVLA